MSRTISPAMVVSASATAADTRSRTIGRSVSQVNVSGVTTNANDWITLPSLNTVPDGHVIRVLCNAGANFEMRTPASSGEKINAVDSDGTQEYLCTDEENIVITKISNSIGWEAHAYSKLGADVGEVVPD